MPAILLVFIADFLVGLRRRRLVKCSAGPVHHLYLLSFMAAAFLLSSTSTLIVVRVVPFSAYKECLRAVAYLLSCTLTLVLQELAPWIPRARRHGA
jgi:hypothetical protein